MKKVGAVILLVSGLCLAQMGEGTFGVSGSFVLPIGDFGDDNGTFDQNGYAMPGFGGGLDFGLAIVHPSFEMLSSAMLLFDFIDRDELSEGVLSFVEDLEGGDYFSVPILIGPRLTLPLRTVQPYFMAQAGLNILIQTELEGTAYGARVERDFDSAVSFAYALGGGIMLDYALNIGFRFLMLGEPEIDYETTFVGHGEREFQISVFQFFVGYQF